MSAWPRCALCNQSPAEWAVTNDGVTVLVCPRGALGMTGEKRRLSIADVPDYTTAAPELRGTGAAVGGAANAIPVAGLRRSA